MTEFVSPQIVKRPSPDESSAKYLNVAGRDRLVARPNGAQYGHLGLEILQSLAEARTRRAPLYLLKPRHAVNDALCELQTPDVRVIRPGLLRGAPLRLRLWLWDRYRALSDTVTDARLALQHELVQEVGRHAVDPRLPEPLRGQLRTFRSGLIARERLGLRARAAVSAPRYYRRRLIREPIPVFLPAPLEDQARVAASRLGIGPETKVITVHAREPGYKRGREVQDKPGAAHPRDDSTRNADIESYFDAVDFLVSQGYKVVRIGDPTMTPVRREGVIDLATSPERTSALEVYCLLRSAFLLGGEAGPLVVAYVTNTPAITVNATDPISSFPIRRAGIYLLKHVVHKDTGRALRLSDMLTRAYLTNLRNSQKYEYVSNTSEEIVLAVREMLELLETDRDESASQCEFRERVTRAAAEAESWSDYARKWGLDDGFLGDGRIARFLADAYL